MPLRRPAVPWFDRAQSLVTRRIAPVGGTSSTRPVASKGRARRALGVVPAAGLLTFSLVLAGCAAPTPTAPMTADAHSALVLADAFELGGFNPISGYGELGTSPLYDGLMALESTGPDTLPRLVPALASAAPEPNADLTVWTVPLRSGVRFHDGSTFDAADVVATYQAVLDPANASPIASSFDMLASVSGGSTTPTFAPPGASPASTTSPASMMSPESTPNLGTQPEAGEQVTFTLKYPYADFPTRLLLAIAPSEKLTGGPASESSLNREPVGTGPYRLTELSAERAVFTAFADHWRGAPEVTTLTTVYLPDDNTRTQRVAAGEFDGTIVPPALARTFEGRAGYEVVSAKSADWRGVSLPADNPFTADPAVRIALNHAVDRQAMVDVVLAGYGAAAYTPVSAVYGDAFDPDATFAYDPGPAKAMLADAGWTPGPDGVLVNGGDRASFTVAYRPTDTVRRDLATAFAADLKRIGVEVTLEGLDFDRIEPRVRDLGVLLGGGDKPYSIDTQIYPALHSQTPGAPVWDNPGNHGSPAMDALLDQARRTTDDTVRTALYRRAQRAYLDNPSYVFLVFLEHTYAVREDDWQRGPLTVEPHSHGVGWGPWWNLASWHR